MTSSGLPESIEEAWGLRTRPNRGPKPGLTLDRIVSGAIAVADADGLDAVSMGRVATEIGSSAMSLYRYVKAKDELLTLMVDSAYGEPPKPAPDDWRAGLTQWAWAEMAVLRTRPWLLWIPIKGPPTTPNQLRWLESGLQSLVGTPLTPSAKMSAILLVTGYTRSTAMLMADVGAHFDDTLMPQYSATLRRLLDPREFPELSAVIAAGTFDVSDDPDDEFVFGLTRILDGIAVLTES